MKKTILLLFTISILVFSCKKEDEEPLKGLVTFESGPTYTDGTIIFTAQIQFAEVGEAVQIEYQLLEGDVVLLSETLETQNADGGLGAFFISPDVTITLDPIEDFSGKELTFWLDPENKVTSDQYTDETNVNLWKKETVSIP